MRTSLDASFYHKERVSHLIQGRGENSTKDGKILVEKSKKIVEGQRPVRVLL